MMIDVSHALRANNGLGYLCIIAVQFGIQPMLSKHFIDSTTATSSLVLVAETAKLLGCLYMLFTDNWRSLAGWKIRDCLVSAGVPSITYLIQNYCIQVAYQNLDGVVFNVLNQSKVLFTALFSFLISGRMQSRMQCLALSFVMLGGILVSLPQNESKRPEQSAEESQTLGVTCVLAAAALSGIGSGITEWSLQRQRRNNFLLSLELASIGCLMILFSLLLGISPDSDKVRRHGLFAGWSYSTMIPVLLQGISGIIVGIITQVAGGVRKVMATICGLLLTCLLQQIFMGGGLTLSVAAAVPLVAAGTYLHASYPPKVLIAKTNEDKSDV
eukprot:TRINITY_DN570_c0_g2_i1.p1 TRINITY_DN570_c0_g2~~TRINITY_DN570_c0_g2_i1.p1  ORF type:complete len:328 (+),score=28.84 TRINITY_DN570_c0_g2_i1:101-1084(+)